MNQRQQLIYDLMDLFGYSQDDFDGMDFEDIMCHLAPEQVEQVERYDEPTGIWDEFSQAEINEMIL